MHDRGILNLSLYLTDSMNTEVPNKTKEKHDCKFVTVMGHIQENKLST